MRLFLAVASLTLLLGCPHPAPIPVTPTPGPAVPFVCAGAASVPGFDGIANELMNAAQVFDDNASLAAIDGVAAARGAAVVLCVIGEILPDLRNAAGSGTHLEMWSAANQPRTMLVSPRRWRRAFLVRYGAPTYAVGI
jgi:hypothetical protein